MKASASAAILKKDNIHISVTLVGDKKIQQLNKEYLQRDCTTDVLSFNLNEDVKDGHILGEIVVNKDQAKRQAKRYGNTVKQEIAELVAHGTLHLLGVHHKDDDETSVHGKRV